MDIDLLDHRNFCAWVMQHTQTNGPTNMVTRMVVRRIREVCDAYEKLEQESQRLKLEIDGFLHENEHLAALNMKLKDWVKELEAT